MLPLTFILRARLLLSAYFFINFSILSDFIILFLFVFLFLDTKPCALRAAYVFPEKVTVPVKFMRPYVNEGNCYSKESGYFTPNQNGIYFFLASIAPKYQNDHLNVQIWQEQRGNNHMVLAQANTIPDNTNAVVLAAVTSVKRGKKIWVKVSSYKSESCTLCNTVHGQ